MVEARPGGWLTLAEAGSAAGRNPELLRRWCVAGRLPCRRMGRDWVIAAADIDVVEQMPRRGGRRDGAVPALDNQSLLPTIVRGELGDCLEPGETIRAVVPGVEDGALVVTDQRVFVVRDGALVGDPHSKLPATWPLSRLRRVQLDAGTGSGALVLTPADPDDRALVLVLGRPHLAHATAAADAIRELLIEAEAYRVDGVAQG